MLFRSSMLQHGSVLLARSVHAPELPGLEDLHGAAIAVDELREAWLAELVKRLGFALVPGELTESERQAAERVMENDPFVQALKREFGATIVPGSVRPI